MSDYRRLISYIYAYEGGVRGKNIGFAKLEIRGDQCRISVNVRRIYAGGNPIGVYLLSGEEEVSVGTLYSRSGTGEFCTVVDCRNVENSGRPISEFIGLTIHDTESAWRAYMTVWEDAVAHAAEVELADVTAAQVQKEEKKPEAPEEEKAPEEALPISREIEAQLEQEELEELGILKIREKKPQSVQEQKDRGEALWQQLRSSHGKVRAFEYADGCEILELKPRDIGLLPRENWVYGSNSFLLHGYYHHGYLILARLTPEGLPPRYLLGVPGHFGSNETYMAAMFGFPDFILAEKQPSGDSRFGYWYVTVKMEEDPAF